VIERWKRIARRLKALIYALYLACRDPRTPWYAQAVAVCVVGYAFSPIDLIPDPIPILGYLDDLILLPLGVALAVKLIPPGVWSDAQAQAAEIALTAKPTNWIAGGIVIALWVLTAVGGAFLVRHWF
jgi:uncharacterized membrane protein YkvA (DUF1232 family)